jgi:dynactin 1
MGQKESSTSGTTSDADALALLEQNEKLKEALMKLRDLSLQEKQEKEKRIKELERENKTIPSLQGKHN